MNSASEYYKNEKKWFKAMLEPLFDYLLRKSLDHSSVPLIRQLIRFLS